MAQSYTSKELVKISLENRNDFENIIGVKAGESDLAVEKLNQILRLNLDREFKIQLLIKHSESGGRDIDEVFANKILNICWV